MEGRGRGRGEVGWGDMLPVTSSWYRSTTLVCTGHRKGSGSDKPPGLFSLFIPVPHADLCLNQKQNIHLKLSGTTACTCTIHYPQHTVTYQPFLWTYNKYASLCKRIATNPSSFSVCDLLQLLFICGLTVL